MPSKQHINDFISQHQLPDKFRHLIDEHYMPLASWLIRHHCTKKPLFLGINGAQGTGKSTLAEFLQLTLEESEGWHVAVLSIDDFYLTKAERKHLSKTIHPLLITRGVPGTHDLQLLSTCIERLRNLNSGSKLSLPRFDKAQDDRASVENWPIVTGPIDLIILEGWCVGSLPQPPDALTKPINALERDKDPDGKWRQFVNEQLKESYAGLFTELNSLFFLQAPNFEAVFRWRLEQEKKLAAKHPDHSPEIMDYAKIETFLRHYERLTRENFKSMPEIADVILELDNNHDCVQSLYISR